ncbi:MAG: three-Cys-motif partner protein TcmP [Kiloniellaceae bacterium]
MKSPQAYSGSEQTYVKHFFLERYLERVAYNIFSFAPELVYVDGFSGPWKSRDEEFKDTSFVIALDKLREMKEGLRSRGKLVRPRCIFIEKDPAKFAELTSAVSEVRDIPVTPLKGSFEDLIPEIVRQIGQSFSFVFIDPTGWTGFDLLKIRPLIELQGEVLINFMFDHINRFVEHPDAATAATIDSLFGGSNWFATYNEYIRKGLSREDAIIETYMHRLKSVGKLKHATSTRIKKPLSERSYFYLVYGTRHWKGVWEFREVERKAADEQERVVGAARHQNKAIRTGQHDLFATTNTHEPSLPFEQQKRMRLKQGRDLLLATLKNHNELLYESVAGIVLEVPLVWVSDLNEWLVELRETGDVSITGLDGRRRTPKPGDKVRWLSPR